MAGKKGGGDRVVGGADFTTGGMPGSALFTRRFLIELNDDK